FSKFGLRPFAGIAVTIDLRYPIEFQKLPKCFCRFSGIKWRADSSDCIENDAIVVLMGYARVKASCRPPEGSTNPKYWFTSWWRLQPSFHAPPLNHFQRERRRNVLAE